jgi:hypothetical protein
MVSPIHTSRKLITCIYRAILSLFYSEDGDSRLLRNTENDSLRKGFNHYSHRPQKFNYGRRSLARPKRKWVNNIKIDLKLIGCGLDSAGLG